MGGGGGSDELCGFSLCLSLSLSLSFSLFLSLSLSLSGTLLRIMEEVIVISSQTEVSRHIVFLSVCIFPREIVNSE